MPPRPPVLCLTAHPDDVAFSFGGTAALLKNSHQIHVIVASRGERGYMGKGPHPNAPSPEIAARRCAEEAAACELLQAPLTFLDLPDGAIYATREVCHHVADLLKALQPVAVFTHHPFEKPDHAALYALAQRALEIAGLFWSTELYMSIRPGECRNPAPLDYYVNISAVIEQKRELVRCHKHHIQSEADVDYWLAPNVTLGKAALCDYAEAYSASLPPIANRWNRPAPCLLMNLPLNP